MLERPANLPNSRLFYADALNQHRHPPESVYIDSPVCSPSVWSPAGPRPSKIPQERSIKLHHIRDPTI